MPDDDGSSIGHATDWKSIARQQRTEITRLHGTIEELRRQHRLELGDMLSRERRAQRRGAERMQERCVYICASASAFSALDAIKQLDVDE